MNIRMRCTKSVNYSHYGVGKNGVVTLEMEEYLRYVVPNEMSNKFPSDALKAQAIAARTFAMYRVIGPRASTYDILDNTNDQSFEYGTQGDAADEAIAATSRQVLTSSSGKVFKSFYHGSSGGTLLAAKDVMGNYPCQPAQDDPWTRYSGYSKYGHQVGMSQRGAQWAGNNGIGYLEILGFYYPGGVIKGDYGNTDLSDDETDDTAEDATTEDTQTDDQANDANETETIDDPRYGYWADSGTIDTLPTDRCAWLFNKDTTVTGKTVMKHIGAYDCSTGNEIQAGGYGGIVTINGVKHSTVHEQALNKGHWSHWCAMPSFIDWTIILAYMRAQLGELYDYGASGPDEWDCSGLAKRAVERVGYDWYHGASTIYARGFSGNSSSSDTSSRDTIRNGSTGSLVKELQTLLNSNGASLKVDGIFGPLTEAAVVQYQAHNGLVQDGVVGPKTWASLTS